MPSTGHSGGRSMERVLKQHAHARVNYGMYVGSSISAEYCLPCFDQSMGAVGRPARRRPVRCGGQTPETRLTLPSNSRFLHLHTVLFHAHLYMNSPHVLHCMEKGIIIRTPICFSGSRFSRGTFLGSKSGGKYLLSTLRSPMVEDRLSRPLRGENDQNLYVWEDK